MSGNQRSGHPPDCFVFSIVVLLLILPLALSFPESRFIFGPNWLTNIPNGRRRALPDPLSALTDWTRMEAEAGRTESHLECGEEVPCPHPRPTPVFIFSFVHHQKKTKMSSG